jgi:hypothetical protein
MHFFSHSSLTGYGMTWINEIFQQPSSFFFLLLLQTMNVVCVHCSSASHLHVSLLSRSTCVCFHVCCFNCFTFLFQVRMIDCVICVVGQNTPTGVDKQHESREAQSLYPSALQLARALRLRFVGHATWAIHGQEGVWCASVSFLYKQTHVNINLSRSRLSGWLLHRLWGVDGNPA